MEILFGKYAPLLYFSSPLVYGRIHSSNKRVIARICHKLAAINYERIWHNLEIISADFRMLRATERQT